MQICETSSELCFTFVPFLHTCMLWFNNIPWEKNCALFFFHHSDFWLPFQCAHSLYLTFDIFLPFPHLFFPHRSLLTSRIHILGLTLWPLLCICYMSTICLSYTVLLSVTVHHFSFFYLSAMRFHFVPFTFFRSAFSCRLSCLVHSTSASVFFSLSCLCVHSLFLVFPPFGPSLFLSVSLSSFSRSLSHLQGGEHVQPS